jgi:hypothetical protein
MAPASNAGAIPHLIVAAVLNFLARSLAGSRRDAPAPG